MNAELQRVEVEAAVGGDDDFAVEHAAGGQLRAERIEQIGEVAVQRLFVAALDQDLVAIAEDQRAKAIPLRLEDPCSIGWQCVDSLGEHRQDGRVDGKMHDSNAIPRGGGPARLVLSCAAHPALHAFTIR